MNPYGKEMALCPADHVPGCGRNDACRAGRRQQRNLYCCHQRRSKSFNPDAQADDYGWPIFQNIFDGLFQLNWNNEIVPNLCETYTISDDGLTYTFNLRKGVKWHDGEPFTSADVEFTFQMIMDNNGVIAQELNTSVAEMSCPDENTFVMVLNAPNSPILGTLAWYANFILPKHLYEGVEDWKTCAAATTNPIGTGAYKFVSYDRGVSVVLEKNPDYHMGEPDVERLIFQVIPDSDTAQLPGARPAAGPPVQAGLLQRRAPLPDRRQYAE